MPRRKVSEEFKRTGLVNTGDKHAVGEPPCAATSHRRVTFARSLRQATRPLSTVTVRTVGFMVCILLHACVWFIPRPPARSARRAAAPPPQLRCSPQKTTNLAPSALEPTLCPRERSSLPSASEICALHLILPLVLVTYRGSGCDDFRHPAVRLGALVPVRS